MRDHATGGIAVFAASHANGTRADYRQRGWRQSLPLRQQACCHRGRVPSAARVWRPWGSRPSSRRVKQLGDERARPRSRFRRSEAGSWTARSPSTGTHPRPALVRPPRASARCPAGPPRSLLQRRHHRDTRRQIPASTPYLRGLQRRRRATKNARSKRSRLSDLGIGFRSRASVGFEPIRRGRRYFRLMDPIARVWFHRRRGHPLHPRPIPPPERVAADHRARVAGLSLRADQAHRSAHRPDVFG